MSKPEISTLTDMIHSGFRLDGRSLTEYREIIFRFPRGMDSDSNGCCVVKIGGTSVMARVSAEVIEPRHFRPSQGMLFVNFDTLLVDIPKNKAKKGGRDEEGQRLSTVLQTLLRDTIDLDSLCIVAWERVFAIRVELRALSYDGNIGDCGALAAISALAAFRRPDVFVQDDGKVIVDVDAKHRPRVPLTIRRIPVLVTLGLTTGAKAIVLDPTAREDSVLCGGRILIGMTGYSEVCCLHTVGLSSPIQPANLARCVRLANSKAQSLVALVQRVIGGLTRHLEANLAAVHARSSELLKRTEDCSIQAPLILSSCSFITTESGRMHEIGFDGVEHEEGELLPEEFDALLADSDNDMDIVSSDEDRDGKIGPNKFAKISAPTNDPYGVIEVSSFQPGVETRLPNDPTVVHLDEFENVTFTLPGVTAHFDKSFISGADSEKRATVKRSGRLRRGNRDNEEEDLSIMTLQ